MGLRRRRSWLWRATVPAAALLTVAIAIAVGAASAPASPAAEPSAPAVAVATPYPYETASRLGPWGFPTRHATDYVAWRFFERDVELSSAMRGPNGRTGRFGDAQSWAANAAHIGFRVDTVPAAGSIAHWNGGEAGAGGAGHVAYVDRVNADGSVVISEFDSSVKYGYSQRGQQGTPAVRAPRYIHVADR